MLNDRVKDRDDGIFRTKNLMLITYSAVHQHFFSCISTLAAKFSSTSSVVMVKNHTFVALSLRVTIQSFNERSAVRPRSEARWPSMN